MLDLVAMPFTHFVFHFQERNGHAPAARPHLDNPYDTMEISTTAQGGGRGEASAVDHSPKGVCELGGGGGGGTEY